MAWTRGPTIGRGSSAAVYLATTTTTGNFFAVKSTDLSSSLSLQKEEHLISQLHSPYIIKSLGSNITYEQNKPVYNLFLEYLPGGTLSDLIRKQGKSLNENAIKQHAFQILLGLNYLHGQGLVHSDIKGQNILIADNGGLKIADFGCAKRANSDASGFSGTPAYMSPEVARGEEQSFAADVWAFGCTVIEMATGSNPWPEMKDPAAAIYRIGFSGEVPEFPGWFSDEAKDFVGMCLMRDPRERWSAAELLQHPFFENVEENCGEMIRKSPTSVMDKGFWDSLEVTDSSENPTAIDESSDSAAGRIRELVGDEAGFPVWTEEEEDWLTVRCNESDELLAAGLFEDFEDSVEAEFVTLLSDDEIRSSILMEDSLLDCLNGDSRISFPVTYTESVIKDFCVLGGVQKNSENYVNGVVISSSMSDYFPNNSLAYILFNSF